MGNDLFEDSKPTINVIEAVLRREGKPDQHIKFYRDFWGDVSEKEKIGHILDDLAYAIIKCPYTRKAYLVEDCYEVEIISVGSAFDKDLQDVLK